MKMHLLSGGRLRMRKSIFLPSAQKGETFELPVPSTLLRHPQGNVLFDTGCHPDAATDADARWGGLAKVMTPMMSKTDNVVDNLACVGLDADDIDLVICSHLHPDHCGCNVFFKRATLIVHANEVKAAQGADAETQGFLAREWNVSATVDEVTGQRDVFGDERIVLLPLPGHTPGTMSALVRLDNAGKFLLASDTVTLAEALTEDIIPRNTWNPDVLAKSLAEIKRIQSHGVTVLYGHDDRQWQTLRKGAEYYD